MPDGTSCSAPDCDLPASKRGLCGGHYQRYLHGKPLDGPIRAKRKPGETPAPCSFEGCGRPVKYKGLCKTHYECSRMGLPLVPIRALMPRTEKPASRNPRGPGKQIPRFGTCSAPNCDREIWARGLCGAHYVRDFTGVPFDKPIRSRRPKYAPEPPPQPGDHAVRQRQLLPPAVCSVDDCDKLAKGGFGLCKTHWATLTGKGAEYSSRRRSRKFDGPHDKITAADYRRMRAETKACYLCDEPLADPVEFDHVIPLARGGRHVLENIRPVHKRCNRVKGVTILASPGLPSLPRQLGLWEEVS